MKRFVLALDLKNEPQLIQDYEQYHQQVWPEIEAQIKASGILVCEIYRIQNRLMMLLETKDDFSFENKNQLDANNPKVQEWENLMWQYQQALPGAKAGEKWLLMEKIYTLS